MHMNNEQSQARRIFDRKPEEQANMPPVPQKPAEVASPPALQAPLEGASSPSGNIASARPAEKIKYNVSSVNVSDGVPAVWKVSNVIAGQYKVTDILGEG